MSNAHHKNRSAAFSLRYAASRLERASTFVDIGLTLVRSFKGHESKMIEAILDAAETELFVEPDGDVIALTALIEDVANKVERFERLWDQTLDEISEAFGPVMDADNAKRAALFQCLSDAGVSIATSPNVERPASQRDAIGSELGIAHGRGVVVRIAGACVEGYDAGDLVIADVEAIPSAGDLVAIALQGSLYLADYDGECEAPVYVVRGRVTVTPVAAGAGDVIGDSVTEREYAWYRTAIEHHRWTPEEECAYLSRFGVDRFEDLGADDTATFRTIARDIQDPAIHDEIRAHCASGSVVDHAG